ncbi:MAG: hypothetical protein A2144_04870 [Chloroflexi bacterium RBG_16_50_9]|nr:MAG: hypothetical protein A2144_04870 [Chloroflexi bacterium RBG_16_50_9]
MGYEAEYRTHLKPLGRKIKGLMLTAILIAASVGCTTLFGMLETRHQSIVTQWPTVSGTVISSEIGTVGSERTHELRIRFAYKVQDVTFQGNQRWPVYTLEEEMKYPPGTPVLVHYNPARPSEALINPIMVMSVWAWLGIISVIVGIIGCIYIWGWWIRGK